MREEPLDVRLRSALLAGIWASSTLLLTWHAAADVAAGDSGEIGGAAFSLGVAHPTGFPLDMLVLRAFALLPLGSIAWRENIGVACIASGAVTGLARLTLWLAEELGISLVGGAAIGALVASCALLGFQTFLASALAVEVYSGALLLVICAALAQRSRGAVLYAWFGLALAAHVTAALLMLPLLAADAISGWTRRVAVPRWLIARCASLTTGALLIAYLPLAARRDSAFDWGDPETLLGLWRHLSAARIREAYAADMFANAQQGAPGLALLSQLAQHAWLCVPASIGLLALWRARRASALTLLSVLSLDLGYAVWVNPMGIAERQLGHASGALLALLAGVGCAWAIRALALRSAGFAGVASCLACALALLLLVAADWPQPADGYALAERYGASSPLLDLAPRAVYACSTDSGCASALFAVYAEGARPDAAVVPAQHLWDRTVTRRLTGVTASDRRASVPPSQRRERAEQTLHELMRSTQRRPLYLENLPLLAAGGFGIGLDCVPWVEITQRALSAGAEGAERALQRLATLERARFGVRGPDSALARKLWASAHDELGKTCLANGAPAAALRALQRAVELTPERAVAHSNLGVAFETQGDLAAALRETRRALELDPSRPTPWLNLTRLMLRTTGRAAALAVLGAAEKQVRDPRLTALRSALLAPEPGAPREREREQAQGVTAK
jgi:tetratricopeptide (TPR) repeat protein